MGLGSSSQTAEAPEAHFCVPPLRNGAIVTDELWEVIEPLLPPEPPKPKGSRLRINDRAALTGIIFMLKSST